MLARPFASDTVIARDTCRLKCSVVASVAAVLTPEPERPLLRPAGRRGSGCRDRWHSRRVSEGMAERLAGALAGHGEHEHARGSVVSDNDLRLVRVVVPFQGDRVTSIVACVEFYEHASIVRLQPTTSHPCQTLGLPTGSTGRAPRRRVRDWRRRPAHATRGDRHLGSNPGPPPGAP